MTLPKLRELAVKAKAYRPPNNCREHPIVACGACAVCLGAHRAVEDIELAVSTVLTALPQALAEQEPLSRCHQIEGVLDWCRRATRVASYFGSPGPVAAFEAGVREMCNG